VEVRILLSQHNRAIPQSMGWGKGPIDLKARASRKERDQFRPKQMH